MLKAEGFQPVDVKSFGELTMELLRKRFPFPIVGINTDNDSSFINESLIEYCKSKEITFTRSRPYKKNDQAWIEHAPQTPQDLKTH